MEGEPQPQPGPEDPLPQLRSVRSEIKSYVCFINRTQRRVDVIWIGFKGEAVKYKTLNPRESFTINTYVSHPWVFRDAENAAKLVVNSKKVFNPRPWFEGSAQEGQGIHGPVSPRRIPVYISIPLYSLKERATQAVHLYLRDRQDAFQLDIPSVLQSAVAEWGQ